MKKYMARKFLGFVGLAIISSVAMFLKYASFAEWSAFNIPIFSAFCGFAVWSKKIDGVK